MMRSFLSRIALVLLPLALSAQQIVEAEYYFDTDPGQGNGLAIPIIANATVELEYDIDLSDLSPGIHLLYFRVKDDSSRWSGLLNRPVYVTSAIPNDPLPTVASMEYYFDTDPGLGNGLAIPLIAAEMIDVEFDIDLSGLTTGFHSLYVRAKDGSSRWSSLVVRPIYVPTAIPSDPLPTVTDMEYFFDVDPGRGLGYPLTAMMDEALVTSGLSELLPGIHTFYTRVRDNAGRWSSILARPVYITPFSGGAPSVIVAVHQAITSDGTRTDLPPFTEFSPSGNLDLEFQMNLDGLTLASTFTTHLYVEDASGNTSDTVSSTVTYLDDPPIAVADSLFAYTGRATDLFPLINDLSEEGDSLSILRIDYSGTRMAEISSAQVITYTSNDTLVGLDTIMYVVQDEVGQLDSATIIVAITAAVGPVLPVWLPARFLDEDHGWTTAIAYFFDWVEEGDTPDSLLIWEAISSAHISAEIVSDTLYIVPEANWHGTEITYLVASDGFLADTTELEFAVIAINDTPEPFALLSPADHETVSLDSSMAHFRWESSYDVDGDSLTYSLRISSATWEFELATADTQANVDMSQLFMPDSSYQWQVIVFDGSDSLSSDNLFTFTMPFALSTDLAATIPTAFALHQNYPNPFNPVTMLRFDIPADTQGDLIVYDLMGKEVATLLDAHISAGYHLVQWNGRGSSGRTVPSGVYIGRLVTPEYTKSIKMVLLK